VLALALFAGNASASIIVQNLTFGGSGDPLSTYPQYVNFNLWNSNWGPLNSVTIELETWLQGTLEAQNNATVVRSVSRLYGSTTADLQAFGGLVGTSVTTPEIGPPNFGPPLKNLKTAIVLQVAPNPASVYTYTNPTFEYGASTVSSSSPTVLAAFEAPGGGVSGTPLTIDVFTLVTGRADGAGVLFGSGGNAYGNIRITYEAIPEPVTSVLVGGALLGLAAMVRRRRSRA